MKTIVKIVFGVSAIALVVAFYNMIVYALWPAWVTWVNSPEVTEFLAAPVKDLETGALICLVLFAILFTSRS